ncbi:MAG: helix-turn-helix domain-containing protein [Nitrososphaerales archaeon]
MTMRLKSTYYRRCPEVHKILSKRRFIPEVKSVVLKLYQHGYKIHTISRALECSTRTIWRWLNVKIGYAYDKIINRRFRNTCLSIQHVRGVIANLIEWLRFSDKGGSLDLDACLRGERPP